MIGLADQVEGLYLLKVDAAHRKALTVYTDCNFSVPSSALWHFRLGHLSHSRMSLMHSKFPFLPNQENNLVCDFCHYAKHRKLPFSVSNSRASNKFELLHFDIWGPLSIPSIHGHRYFLTVLDDYSRFVWIIPFKIKSEVSSLVQNFVCMVENQFDAKVKKIRSDNGPEFNLKQFFDSKGIIHQKICVESPQQNGRVERKHQHILNVGRAILFHSKLPKNFWSYAFTHATYIINRVCTPLLNNHSPYFLLYNELPNLHELKVFGSLVYASTLTAHRTKLQSRAKKSVFLGYIPGIKGYVLYDLHTREIFVSRNVIFHENILPYSTNKE
jgi:hypothetical protein